jgi:four helix bundle protein
MSEADDLQRRADAFADASIRFVEGLPHTLVAQRLGGQYHDAATSAAANYRAARHGRSYAKFTAKMGITSEEADESVFWLERLVRANICSDVPVEPLLDEARQLARIFAAAFRTAKSRRRRR